MKFDGVEYFPSYGGEEVGRPLKGEDLGRKFAEVRANISDEGPGHRIRDGDATFLEPGTPVYAVRGYDPSFRLAARQGKKLVLYEAVSNPGAREGSDLLDVGGKVSSIDVARWDDAGEVLGTIDDPGELERLVRGIVGAPVVKDFDPYEAKNTYQVVFHLEDGTATVREYRTNTGKLAPGIVTPKGFREAVGESVEGPPKKRGASREESVAEATPEE